MSLIKKIITLSLCVSTVSASVFAGSVKELKAGFKERLPIIKELRISNIIGESNEGYIVYRVNDKKQEQVINAENKARKILYKLIAKKEGVSINLVGKRRAKQIAKKAKSGEWIQTPNGDWTKKK